MKLLLVSSLCCALLGTNAYTIIESNKLLDEARATVTLERDIAYADGYRTALFDVAVGACDHLEQAEYVQCKSRFDTLVERLSAQGKQAQGVTNE